MDDNIHYLFKSVYSKISFKAFRFLFLTLLLCISFIVSSSPSVFAHFKSEQYQESPSEESSYATSDPRSPPGLIAYYSFDGDTTDHSGYGNDCTNYGATFTAGISGRALSFDGTDDYVRVPVDINPNVLPQVTITAWVKPEKIEGTVISHDNGGYDRTIDIDNRGGGTGWSAFSGSGAVLGYHPVTIGEWVFIAAAYNQDAGTVTLYVNDAVYEESGTLGPGWDYFHIGSNPSFGGHFSGVIDEVQIYNYALSSGQAFDLYENRAVKSPTPSPAPAPTPTPTPSPTPTPVTTPFAEAGLVAYYPFDQDVKDYSGNGNNGAIEGNLSFVSAAAGNGVKFDGKSFIRVADSSSLDLYNAFSISTWLYKEDAGTGGWSVILSKGDTSALGNDSPYALAHTIDGLFPSIRLTQTSYTNISSTTRTDFKEWHFLTVTWDRQNVKFYVNGSLTDTKTWNGTLPNSGADLLIGCDPPGATEYFKGIIDELRIYNYALTSGDINTLYSQGNLPSPSPIPSPVPSPAPAPAPAPTPVPSPTPSPTPSPVPSPVPTATGSLIFESRSKPSGSEVQIPLTLTGASEQIGNMDIALSYDPAVLIATDAIKGGLTSNSLFDFNVAEPGVIRISLADQAGFSGLKGSVANIRFNVIGTPGATSPLRITSMAANRASDSALMSIGTQDGIFTVVTGDENRGDYDGDGKWTALDALAALQMAVGKRAEDLIMDVNDDDKVTSLDAREILKRAVSLSDGASKSAATATLRELSEDQKRTVDMYGWPHSFSLVEVEGDEGEYIFSESWTYYDGEITYIFVDGEYQTWEPVEPIPLDSLVTPYLPTEFRPGASPNEVALAIGSGDSWEKMEDADELFKGILDGAEIYVAPQLVAAFYENRLVFLEALALTPVGEEE